MKAEREAKLKAEKVGLSQHDVNVENQLGLEITYGNAYLPWVVLDGEGTLREISPNGDVIAKIILERPHPQNSQKLQLEQRNHPL